MSPRTLLPCAFLAARFVVVFAISAMAAESATSSDSFGNGSNQFTIDFVTIGNAGNGSDTGGGGGTFSSQYGGVGYSYRIGTYEISQDAIAKATASGMINVFAGAWAGGQPAANISWYEAAAFVNWLNTSTGHQAAYDLTWNGTAWTMSFWSSAQAWTAGGQNLYRHKDAYYFLPSEDEWYKAGYHKNDGATANYWDYATGSNNAPTAVASGTSNGTAVYNGAVMAPAPVNTAGGSGSYGNIGQNGNVFEWAESAFTAPNNSTGEPRVFRGGSLDSGQEGLNSASRFASDPSSEFDSVGFRVASIAMPDTDDDGIPDQFETNTGIYVSPANTGTSPGNADSDGDGFKDGFEVSAGFNPTSVASTPETLSSIVKAGSSSVDFRFNAAIGISYRIEASPDLAAWSTIESPIIGTGGGVTRSYSTLTASKRFFRPRRN